MNRRSVTRMMAPVVRRMRLLMTRAVVRLVDPATLMQRLQVEALAGEVIDDVEHFEPYGYTSRAKAGAEAVVINLGGTRSHAVAIVVADRRYRLTGLAEGEVALHDDQGQKVVLYRDRIEVEAPKVVVLSDDVHLGAEGGGRVARIGDRVNVGSGSSAGLWPIVEGSDKVSCA